MSRHYSYVSRPDSINRWENLETTNLTGHIVAFKNSNLSVSDAILILWKVVCKKSSKGSKSCRNKDLVHFQLFEKGIDGKADSDLVGRIIS